MNVATLRMAKEADMESLLSSTRMKMVQKPRWPARVLRLTPVYSTATVRWELCTNSCWMSDVT